MLVAVAIPGTATAQTSSESTAQAPAAGGLSSQAPPTVESLARAIEAQRLDSTSVAALRLYADGLGARVELVLADGRRLEVGP